MAISLTSLGNNREARQLLEEVLTLSIKNFQPRDPVRNQRSERTCLVSGDGARKELRDSKRAIQLSKELVELLPAVGACWNSYGVAQYRDGDWKGAVESLTKSITLSKTGDSNDFFFLAMASWQLGQKEAARKWYDKAVQWMEKNQPKNPELVRFRRRRRSCWGLNKNEARA